MNALPKLRPENLGAAVASSGVLFGLRTVAATLATLWLAMALQLETPRWAAWTVMSLALPTRGQVGIKGLWRVGGSVLGVVAAVVGIALFAQEPMALGIFLALWCGLNSYAGGRLPGLASYGTALSSLTAGLVIVLSAPAPLLVFQTGLARGVDVTLGVGCVYVVSALAEALHCAPPGPAFAPSRQPNLEQVSATAIRTTLVVSVAWTIWMATAWPSGGIFAVFAAVTAVIFATMPDADRRSMAFLSGVVVGQIAGLLVRYLLLTAPSAFGLLAAILAPFLFIGALGMTDSRTTGAALGYNLSFLIAVEPLNPMQYDLVGSLNETMAVFAGILFGTASYHVVLPSRVWRVQT